LMHVLSLRCSLMRPPPTSTLFPYTTLFRSKSQLREEMVKESSEKLRATYIYVNLLGNESGRMIFDGEILVSTEGKLIIKNTLLSDRKSTRLNSSHVKISYAVFCLKKKKKMR